AALLSDAATITADALSDLHLREVGVSTPVTTQSGSMDEQVTALERSHLEDALHATNWNISHAAARLGIARNTLRYRMSKHGLTAPSKQSRSRIRPPAAPTPSAEPKPTGPRVATPRARNIEWERRRITFVQTQIGAESLEATASDIARLMEEVLGKVQSFGARISDLGPWRWVSVFGMEPAEDAPSQAAHMAMTAQNVAKRAGSVAIGVCPAVTIAIHTRQCLVGRIGDTAEIDSTDCREAQSVL